MGSTKVHASTSDSFAWALNVSTSVVIVFANKVLLDSKTGHGFQFATTLCGLHFLACASSVWFVQMLGLATRAYMPWADILKFAVIANISIASLNLSLLVNSVGFYQVAKLLIIPCVCFMEIVLLRKRITLPEALSILLVVAGVAVVTVTDLQVNALGLIIAVVSVLSSGMQQVMCGVIQRKYHLSSHQLLSNTAHIQGMILLAVGPYIDQLVSNHWILEYTWTAGAMQALAASCALAVLVNISQFMCLGRFSAVTFQVLGHAKTILVLLASWIVFKEPMTSRKLTGICMALAGMIAYSLSATRRAKSQQHKPQQAKPRLSNANHTATLATSAAADSSFVTAEVSLQPNEAHHKQLSAKGGGVLASYPLRLTDDGAATLLTASQKSSEGGVSSDIRDDGHSIAANVLRRHRRT